jgi:hypothetical protein
VPHCRRTDPGAIHAAAVEDLGAVSLLTDDRVSATWRARVLPALVVRAALGHRP